MEILVTGKKFTASGFRAIQPVIEELIDSADHEMHMAVYLFTPSAINVLERIQHSAERGVRVTLVINRIPSQPEVIRNWIQFAKSRFPHVTISDFKDPEGGQLHAKVMVIDRKMAIVGSANFSWGGMVSNYEVAVLLEGQPAWKLAAAIDDLTRL